LKLLYKFLKTAWSPETNVIVPVTGADGNDNEKCQSDELVNVL